MLSWFKKKFTKESSQETPAPEAENALIPSEEAHVEESAEIAVSTEAKVDAESIEPAEDKEIAEQEPTESVDAPPVEESTTDTNEEKQLIAPVGSEIILAHEGEPEQPAENASKTIATINQEIKHEETLEGADDAEPEDLPDEQETVTDEHKAAEQPAEAQPSLSTSSQPEKKKSFFSRLSDKLSRTRESFTYQIENIFYGEREIDKDALDNLEEILITADLGVAASQEIIEHARKKVNRKELDNLDALKNELKQKILAYLTDYQADASLVMPESGPFVIMVVGVNGVGKTTTIGKIAHKFIRSGHSVMLVAGDTFRAAAVSQLKIWGERNNVHVMAQKDGADPSSVVFDGMAYAQSKGYDVVLVDTAGRLHTSSNLMEELKKIKRVMTKKLPGAPHEVLLVLDATTGQNALSQAKFFTEAVGVTGLTITKLDGTAKGGILVNLCREMKLPVRFIGIGEQIEDLRDFDPEDFVNALFSSPTHPHH